MRWGEGFAAEAGVERKERGGAGRIDNLLMLYVSRDRLDIWSRYLPIL